MESRDKQPFNLNEKNGSVYEIALDEAVMDNLESETDSWYFQIPCKYGHIYPHSSEKLAYYCEGGKIRAKLKKEHPEIEIVQWAEDIEAVFLFTPDQFDIIAVYAQPRKKRRTLAKSKEVLNRKNSQNTVVAVQ